MSDVKVAKFSIREASVQDAGKLSALSFHTWLDTYAKDGVRDSYAKYLQSNLSPADFESMIKNPERAIWIAEIGISLVGFIVIANNSLCPIDDLLTTEITTLYVFKRFANNGLGGKLLRIAINKCKAAHLNSLWLSTNHENEVALKFYHNQGFSIVGTLMFQLDDGEHPNHILSKTF